MDPNLISSLCLIRSRRVGPSTYHRLLAEYGTAQAALEALPEIASQAGVKRYAACGEEAALAELSAAKSAGARPLLFGRSGYPPAFAALDDPPPFLWALGDISLLAKPAIALVGARNASSLGTRMARKLAVESGQAGYVVISGLARGVDAAAHDAALQTGTIAVMAGGVDMLYPPQNRLLYEKIGQMGLILSEQPMGVSPQARHFPRRNRLISGLSSGVVVVEAALKSGSMITARDAVDQGREVFAVPGHPLDARASGCNALLRDGARLVRDFADIAAELRPLSGVAPFKNPAPATAKATSPPPSPPHANDIGQNVLAALSPSPISEDELIRSLGQPAAQVSRALTRLELEGALIRQSGGLLALAV